MQTFNVALQVVGLFLASIDCCFFFREVKVTWRMNKSEYEGDFDLKISAGVKRLFVVEQIVCTLMNLCS